MGCPLRRKRIYALTEDRGLLIVRKRGLLAIRRKEEGRCILLKEGKEIYYSEGNRSERNLIWVNKRRKVRYR